jgi:glycosyltransferase involved in cell wall biosynthesis
MIALASPSRFDAAAAPVHGRVCIFLPALLGGGAERAMVNLAAGFIRRGVPVDMVLGIVEGPYLSQLDKAVRIVPLNAVGTLSKLWALSRYLKRERPMGMIAVLDNINLASMARRIAGVQTRVVINVQSNLSADLASHRGLRGWIKPKLMRVCYPWADELACVSAGVGEDLAAATRLPNERVKVIFNPVRVDEIDELSAKSSGHPWFDQPDIPVFLGTGRLTKQKDFPTLLKAFARLRGTRRARLAILGQGDDLAALQNLVEQLGIAEDVAFLGFVANPYAYMARASVFVLSSAWEGLPTVLIEAMACGTPVVSTDCPSGPREILADGLYGQLTDVGDADGLADAMSETLDSPCGRDLLRSRAGDFTAERVVDQYLGLFK